MSRDALTPNQLVELLRSTAAHYETNRAEAAATLSMPLALHGLALFAAEVHGLALLAEEIDRARGEGYAVELLAANVDDLHPIARDFVQGVRLWVELEWSIECDEEQTLLGVLAKILRTSHDPVQACSATIAEIQKRIEVIVAGAKRGAARREGSTQ